MQEGHHGVVHQVAHLARDARHGDKHVTPALDDEAGCGTNRIGDRRTASGEHGLHAIAGRHLSSPAREHRLDLLQHRVVEQQVAAGGSGHRLARDVVHRRAQAAGGNHDLGAFERLTQDLRRPFDVIADGRAVIDAHADARQELRDVRGIGVHDLS